MKLFFLIYFFAVVIFFASCNTQKKLTMSQVTHSSGIKNKVDLIRLPICFEASPYCGSELIISSLKDSLSHKKIAIMDTIEYRRLFNYMIKNAFAVDYNKVFLGQAEMPTLDDFKRKITNANEFARSVKLIDSTCFGLNRIHIELNNGTTKFTKKIIIVDRIDTISNLNKTLLDIILKK